METQVVTPEWDSEDVSDLRTFLQSRAGRRLLPKLVETIPPLLEEGDTNKVLIRTGKVSGAQDIIKSLLALAGPPDPVVEDSPTNYPSLTDDKHWEDGNKIE